MIFSPYESDHYTAPPEPAQISGSKGVFVRFPMDEHAALVAEAERRGMSAPELLRTAWFLAQMMEANVHG